MRARAALASAIALFATAPALAQESADAPDDQIMSVNGAWADPAKCNLGNARRMPLAEALRRVDTDFGRCVAIPVYIRDQALFATRRTRAPSEATDAQEERIGFYAKDRVTARAARHPDRRYWVIGNLSECDRQWPDVMVMGYCHYNASPAPILIVAEVRPAR